MNGTLDQTDFTEIFRALPPKTAENTYFWSVHGTFSTIDHTLGEKLGPTSTKRLTSYHAYF